jgi:hypothetical protein
MIYFVVAHLVAIQILGQTAAFELRAFAKIRAF